MVKMNLQVGNEMVEFVKLIMEYLAYSQLILSCLLVKGLLLIFVPTYLKVGMDY